MYRVLRKNISVFLFVILSVGILNLSSITPAFADGQLETYVDSLQQAKEGVTLWQTIRMGGVIMIVLAGMSIAATAIIIHNFMTLKIEKLTPVVFSENIVKQLGTGKIEAVKSLCQRKSNIISSIVLAGIKKKPHGPMLVREAMENCARKEVNHLWQKISYLADIASVAPLVGLLGTVLGMIQAFNVIAFQSAVVKPMLLAGGISKAMITTAGGLIVAIPAMLLHAYFKGKILEISNAVETYSTDLIKLMEKN
ncbi:hypothetical protein MNBD_UNCLBAC01-855 [hydrothermal vent metagenome]|uniref:MotA/TolQ/ExbB proton channel domain-containing protein n=1 Tax=hydrothermal vent metagenome TaxID=652676 RepID=A0A3B1DP63_9ZZZZ